MRKAPDAKSPGWARPVPRWRCAFSSELNRAFSSLWYGAGLVVLYPFGARGKFLSRLRTVALGTLLGIAAFLAVHAPFAVDAYRRGFGPQFIGQYTSFVGLLRWEFQRELSYWLETKSEKFSAVGEPSKASSNEDEAVVPGGGNATEAAGRDGRRPRPSLSEAFSGRGIYFYAAALWLPVLVIPALVLSGIVMLVLSLATWNEAGKTRALVMLATTGCALSLFPQYFFFRPDSVHLNEFLVAFWPASLCSAWALAQAANDSGFRVARLWSSVVALLVVLLFVVSFNALFGRDGSGSIMSARGDNTPFIALNGVRARVKTSEIADWEGLRDAVITHSGPGEFVVTYPYVPIVNVMCDRPTYQWSLYVDNATASSSFQDKEGDVLRERKPAVVVINDRAINKTEQSRFSNWASSLYGQIRSDYELVGTFFGRVEVYALHRTESKTEPFGTPAR